MSRGFVICYNYYDKMVDSVRKNLGEFLIARFARLYPMYLLTFIWMLSIRNLSIELHLHWRLILENLTMIQAWNSSIGKAYSYNSVAWSISVEAFLYLCFPVGVFLLLRRLSQWTHYLTLAICVCAVSFGIALWFVYTDRTNLAGDAHYWLYRLPATRVLDFFLGCALARIIVLRAAIPVGAYERVAGQALLALSILAAAALMLTDRPFLVPFRFDAGYAPFFAVIIFCLARYDTFLSRVLGTKVFVLLGSASYSYRLNNSRPDGAGRVAVACAFGLV